MSDLSPYGDNLLIDGLGSIPSRQDMGRRLCHLPPRPPNIASVPYSVRIHWLMMLRELHLPRREELRVAESLDVAIRQSYHQRNPAEPGTWSKLCHEPLIQPAFSLPAGAVSLVGNSGTGKTEAVTRILRSYPQQLIRHDSFPKMKTEHWQVAWLSICVPPSGRTIDLARALMEGWQKAVRAAGIGLENRFDAVLTRERQSGHKMLDEWRQVACCHFLGLLHLDEIQNLFKLLTLEQRRKRQSSSSGKRGASNPWAGLPIVEDHALKWILSVANEWGMALCVSGTPDGIRALQSRSSTGQRISTIGHHAFKCFSATDKEFTEVFFPHLIRFQYVANPIEANDELVRTLMRLTAGIPRMLIALWIAAHRTAFERNDDTLRLQDFDQAASTFLAPAMPAIAALNSGDPRLIERFEDLWPDNFDVWEAVAQAA